MRLLKVFSVLVVLAGMAALALVVAPVAYHRVHAQDRPDPGTRTREFTMLAGRGAALGVSIRDLDVSEADKQKLPGGVVVSDVGANSPAEKAGLKRGDIVVEFDGEHVRSARQFTRLVQETTPGRAVKATVVRDGKRTELQVTPDERRGDLLMSGDWSGYFGDLGRDLGRLGDQLPNFTFDLPSVVASGRRLGVTVDPLTDQLASYFGAKEGVLVTSVTENTPASRAGLKAGDVITSIDGTKIRSREDLLRGIRDARDGDEVSIGIVRDRKESTLKTKIDAPRRTPRGRPI